MRAALEKASGCFVVRTACCIRPSWQQLRQNHAEAGSPERDSLNVVFDQIGSPTYARDLAEAIVAALPKLKPGVKEIYHFSDEGVCSWYDFAVAIMALSGLKCVVKPIESKDYPTPAKRPFYSDAEQGKDKKGFGN